MEIVLGNAQMVVGSNPQVPGMKIIQFIELVGGVPVNKFTIPLDENGARSLAAMLGAGIIVAQPNEIPPEPRPDSNGNVVPFNGRFG